MGNDDGSQDQQTLISSCNWVLDFRFFTDAIGMNKVHLISSTDFFSFFFPAIDIACLKDYLC